MNGAYRLRRQQMLKMQPLFLPSFNKVLAQVEVVATVLEAMQVAMAVQLTTIASQKPNNSHYQLLKRRRRHLQSWKAELRPTTPHLQPEIKYH